MSEQWLKTAVSGSFKFKPEIDRLHEEFADYQVEVLEPTQGWLYIPSRNPGVQPEFRPLPEEVGMGIKEVEDRFFAAIDRSDFMYLHNSEGYIGTSMAMEIAWANRGKTPIFAKEPIRLHNADGDLGLYALLLADVVVATPAEAAAITREGSFDDHRMSDMEMDTKIALAASDPANPMYLLGRRATFGRQGLQLGSFGQP
jgi:hypothetical protein